MGNNNYKSLNNILYNVEIDKDIFLSVCARDNKIYEMIRILNQNIESELLSSIETSSTITYKFENNINLKIFKSKKTYSLDYDNVILVNKLYKIEPIHYFSENIDKIYYGVFNDQ